MDGYIKLHRKVLNSSFCSGSIDKLGFWVTLLMQANYKNKTFYMGTQKVDIKRGQLLTGRKQLAQLCRVSEMKIERWLNVLEIEQQIEQQKTNRYRIITILNYDTYQDIEQLNAQQMNNKRTTDEQQMNTTNKGKNEKKEKKTIQGDFDNFIKTFNELTRKQYRATDGLRAKYNTRRKTFSVEEIERAMRALVVSPYHTGKNDRGMYYATPEFLLRSDEQVDKWLNFKSFAKKPQEKDKLLELAIKNGITIEN